MANPFQRLGAFLNRPLQLSPAQRSMLAQKLLEQSQQPVGTVSPAGTANKVLQGILARRSGMAEQQAQQTTSARQQALAGALARASSQDPNQAEAARRAAGIISGGLPEDPLAQAVLGQQAKNAFAPPPTQEARLVPLSEQEKATLGIPRGSFAQRNSQTGEIKIDDAPPPPAERGPEPVVQVAGPGGKPVFVRQSEAPGRSPYIAPEQPKPPSEGDKRSQVLFRNIEGAERQIMNLTEGTDSSSRWNSFLGWLPGLQTLQSDEFRKYEAAGLRWAANLLYLKSGAQAGEEEIASTWKQFFPQPGEGPDVISQKETARTEEVNAIATTYGFERKQPRRSAPQAALDYLSAHPETSGEFKEKYGYLPDE